MKSGKRAVRSQYGMGSTRWGGEGELELDELKQSIAAGKLLLGWQPEPPISLPKDPGSFSVLDAVMQFGHVLKHIKHRKT